MNKKRFLSLILAVLIAAFSLVSCCGGAPDASDSTTDTPLPEKPTSPGSFSERLENALQNEVRTDVLFEVREKHVYNPSSSMEKGLFAKWQSDFSDFENPRFLYSVQRSLSAPEPELLLFYDGGFFYVKSADSQYRQPADLDHAKGKIPCDGLTALLGDEFSDILREASITENEDGTVTASISLSLFDKADGMAEYLKLFGIEASGHPYGMDGDPCEISVSVCMDGDRLLSYTVETVMAGFDLNRELYPVTYTVKAVYGGIENGNFLLLPDEEARAGYKEAEPEISDITAEEFLRRFEKSDEVSGGTVYTEMITNSSVTYEFSEGYQVQIPILNVTAIDLSKPRAPKIAVVETKLDATGSLHKKETYYKDDTFYFSENGNRVAVPYPAEEYLADVEASAKEKEEAGISTFFLSADMLANAVLTVGSDQSVSAVMDFDGSLQEKNIFHHIRSVYNDDLASMQSASILSTSLAVTLDRFNYLTSYTLTVTAAIESEGVKALATYVIRYHFDYSETPREIEFPNDLADWGTGSENGEACF